jgi:polar amino acid transport system substrate-binding protein
MKKQRVLVSLFLVAALMLGMAGMATAGKTQNNLVDESTLTTVLKRGALRAGFSTFVPWAMKDKSGNFIGFEIDVMTKLAEDMGVKIEVVPTKWAGIIPALMTGKFDVIISGMGITPQRNLKVNYSDPYYYSGLTLMANKELCKGFNPTKLEDFNRPEVVFSARMGVTAVSFIKKYLPKAQIREFDDMTMAYREVITGKAHASLNDAPEPSFQVLNYP